MKSHNEKYNFSYYWMRKDIENDFKEKIKKGELTIKDVEDWFKKTQTKFIKELDENHWFQPRELNQERN